MRSYLSTILAICFAAAGIYVIPAERKLYLGSATLAICSAAIISKRRNRKLDSKELIKRGIFKGVQNDHLGAIKDYTKAIKLDQSNAFIYFKRAEEKVVLGNYLEAINDYNKAIEINPKDADSYYGRANAKAITKNYIGAIDDYTKSAEIKPKYAFKYLIEVFPKLTATLIKQQITILSKFLNSIQ